MSPGKGMGKAWDGTNHDFVYGYMLYLRDNTLGNYVYDALWKTKNFRLVFHNKVICAKPATNVDPCKHDPDPLWKSDDMYWDHAGCLVIKNNLLGQLISDAHDANNFQLVVNEDRSDTTPPATGTGGGVEENKVNAMCFC